MGIAQHLTKAQGRSILHPVWKDVCAKFEEHGFFEPIKARVQYTEEAHDSCRHFARAAMDGSFVEFAPSLAMTPMPTIVGIMAHEAGHLVDLSHPGVYWLKRETLTFYQELPQRGLKRLLAKWHARSDDEVERIADLIAESVMGFRIGYVGGECLVQCADCDGPSRPKGLR